MTQPASACGRKIHMAARALQTVRNTALEHAGIAFPYWAVLEAVAENPGMSRETLIRRLVDMTVHDETGAGRAIDELHERGLIATSADKPGIIAPTPSGNALVDKVVATRSGLRRELYGGIPPQDMATTMRVLDLITTRARALHEAQPTSTNTTNDNCRWPGPRRAQPRP